VNFFEHQERARSSTRNLVLLFATAVITLILVTTFLVIAVLEFAGQGDAPALQIGTVSFAGIFPGVAIVVLGIVLSGSWFRTLQLRSGGRAVAESLGGRLLNVQTRDAEERRILNVVEEMAIAAGLPVPPVYLLEDQAINAFAAGFEARDAVIGITRGCISQLSRDELQGVIAHEFSHIFNGDMRLNIRLIGWLYGIMVLGMIGYYLMRGSVYRSGRGSRDGRGGIVLLGLGLLVIGYSGTFFGNLIKAAVSRQREFLADASAVQFTRNPGGIGGALKKIGGLGAEITVTDTSEISHMLFAQGLQQKLFGLFATHPPLEERIRRLDPYWKGDQAPRSATVETYGSALSITPRETAAASFVAAVGQPDAASMNKARQQLQALPAALREETRTTLGSSLLMHALLVACSEPPAAAIQLELLQANLNDAGLLLFHRLKEQAAMLPRELYLPLVELALPSLTQLSRTQYEEFLGLQEQLITADGKLTLFEWCIYRILRHSLSREPLPKAKVDLQSCASECMLVLSAVAVAGHRDAALAEVACAQGIGSLGFAVALEPFVADVPDPARLDQALDRLRRLKPLQKPRLLKALVLCIAHDGKTTAAETELLRAIAAILDCPVPPLAW